MKSEFDAGLDISWDEKVPFSEGTNFAILCNAGMSFLCSTAGGYSVNWEIVPFRRTESPVS